MKTQSLILDVIKEISTRMKDPDLVKSIVTNPSNRNPNPIYNDFEHRWSDLCIAGGYPATLLLFSELDRLFPDEKWDAASHAHVLKIKESIETNGIHSTSLYAGLTGTCFAIQQSSRGETRYQRLLNTLNSHLLEMIKKTYLIPLNECFEKKEPVPISLYDIIEGLSGVGVYCLQRIQEPAFLEITKEILMGLVKLTEPIKVEGKWVPGWHVPSRLQFLDTDKERFPKGNFNLGLAHGIPGVLALLSIASLHGIQVEGQQQAILRMAEWIQKHRRENEKGFFWETVIPFEDEGKIIKNPPYTGRDAWCYGTPGVASSMYLAGRALKSEEIKKLSLETFRCVFNRTVEEWHLPGPTFCHGISGLLLITHSLAQQTGEQDLKVHVRTLTKTLYDYHQPDAPFGFHNYEPTKDGSFAKINKMDILEGAVGILLTLLTVENSVSWWHAPFLISSGKIE